MITCVLGGLSVMVVLALGGSPSRLAKIRLRGSGWVGLALLAQVVALSAGADPDPELRPLLEGVHVASYVIAGGVLWVNRGLPGLWLIGIGAASNGLTIAVNGGTLPARPQALRAAGLDVVVDGFANSGALSDPRLWFLGDVFAVPDGVPLANVFSMGDVAILLGLLLAIVRICGTRRRPPWSPPDRDDPPPAQRRRSVAGSGA